MALNGRLVDILFCEVYNGELSGSLAQLVEQRTFNPLVAGSIPARPISDSDGVDMKDRIKSTFMRFVAKNKALTVALGFLLFGLTYWVLSFIFFGLVLVLGVLGGFYFYRLISKATKLVEEEKRTIQLLRDDEKSRLRIKDE